MFEAVDIRSLYFVFFVCLITGSPVISFVPGHSTTQQVLKSTMNTAGPACDIYHPGEAPRSVEDALEEYDRVLKRVAEKTCRELGLSSSDSNDARQKDGDVCFSQDSGNSCRSEENNRTERG